MYSVVSSLTFPCRNRGYVSLPLFQSEGWTFKSKGITVAACFICCYTFCQSGSAESDHCCALTHCLPRSVGTWSPQKEDQVPANPMIIRYPLIPMIISFKLNNHCHIHAIESCRKTMFHTGIIRREGAQNKLYTFPSHTRYTLCCRYICT